MTGDAGDALRVLIVDDQELVRAGFRLILERAGIDVVGEAADGKKALWVFARQHPGEPMAEWYMEGFVERLLDETDGTSRALLEKAVIYAVPNMNPDGSARGHLRTNAAGTNLNREWDKASLEKSPEVFHVLNKMKETGVALSLDVHGDEALPYNFIAGAEGIEGWSEKDQALLDLFRNTYAEVSPDFQTEKGYPVDAPGSANLAICTNYIAKTFGCLAMTLEMPFKDTMETPDHDYGWSPERCARLGGAVLDVMWRLLPSLD